MQPGPAANDDDVVTSLDTPLTFDVTANDIASANPLEPSSVDLDPATPGQQTTVVVSGEGTFSVDGFGNVTFTPEAGFTGVSAISYTIEDTAGGVSNEAAIRVRVNAPPVAADDSAFTPVDTPVTLSVIANDADADGALDASSVDLDPSTAGRQTTFVVAGEGTFSADDAGNVTFTPEAGFTGVSSALYAVADNDGDVSNTAALAILAAAGPAANDDNALTQLDTPVTFNITANDVSSDSSIDPSTVDLDPNTAGQQTSITVSGEGTFSVDASGNVTFTPEAGFTGISSVTYVVDDALGSTSNVAAITVRVNAPPVAVDDSALTQLDTPVSLAVTNNDSDADGVLDVTRVDLDPGTAGQQTTLAAAGEGTYSVDGAGNVTFTPEAGFTGVSAITYTVTDDDGGVSNTATITVRVNAPPVAVDDSALTQLDTPVTLAVTANDSDSDGVIDAATVDLDPVTPGRQNAFGVAGEGTFSDDGAGNVTFTPEAGFTGISAIPYTVNDNDGSVSNAATITVTVNAPPAAVDDSALTQLDTPVTLAVTANDSDSDGVIDATTVDLDPATPGQQSAFTVLGEGTYSDDGAGNVTFTPQLGFTGTSTTVYTVNDNDGGVSNSATISVRVNAPPVAIDDAALTQLDTPVTLSVSANDSDSDGVIDATTVDLDPGTAGQQSTFVVAGEGTYSDDGAGNVTFAPLAGFTGVSSISYTVNDNDGATSNAATVTVRVNAPPVAVDDSALTQLDTPVTLAVTANDSDSDGVIDATTVDLDPATPGQQSAFTVAGEGVFAADGAGNVTFTPDAGFTGVSTIPYTVNDNDGGLSNSATITVRVNAPPVANNDSAVTQLDTPVTQSVTTNDSDSDGVIDATTVDLDPATPGQQSAFTVAGEGVFAADGAGNVTFTPDAGFTGVSTIPYTVNDNDGGLSNSATISVRVNAPPSAINDSAVTPLDTPVTLGVTANDSDSDGVVDAATVDLDPGTPGQQTTLTVSGEGTFSADGSGNVTFTPEAGFTGTSTIPYTVNDNDGGISNAATISVRVNAPPTAIDDTALTQLNTPATLAVTTNDSDSDGSVDPASVDLDPGTAGQQTTFVVAGEGSFSDDGAGNVTFTPVSGFTGVSSISYTVTDTDGATSNAATITITVNAPPVAVDDSALTQLDTPATLAVTTNDSDSDGVIDATTVDLDPSTPGQQSAFTVVGEGVFADDGFGNVTFTPEAGFTGVSAIPYTVNDNDGGLSNIATISVRVNDPPAAVNDSAVTPVNTPVTLSVTANDSDSDGVIDAATVDLDPAVAGQQSTLAIPGEGTFSDDGLGNVTFTPVSGFTGVSTITYTVSDNDGAVSNTASIAVTVQPGPAANDDDVVTSLDTPLTFDVTANDIASANPLEPSSVDLDPATPGQQTTVVVSGEGTFSVDGFGNVTFTPEAGFTGVSAISYTIEDTAGGVSNEAAIRVRVNAPPVAADDSAFTPVDTPVTLSVIANDADADGALDASSVDLDPSTAGRQTTFVVAGEGTFSADDAGNVTFTPEPGFTGVSGVSYTVNDDNGDVSNTAAINITVVTGPAANDDNAFTQTDVAVTFNVTANDVGNDSSIDPSTVDLDPNTAGQQTSITVSGEGTFSVDASGNVTFTPEAGFTGISSVTYVVDDALGSTSNVAAITVRVNAPPVAVDDSALTQLDTPVSLAVTNNDSDADGVLDVTRVDLDPGTAGQQTTLAAAGRRDV